MVEMAKSEIADAKAEMPLYSADYQNGIYDACARIEDDIIRRLKDNKQP